MGQLAVAIAGGIVGSFFGMPQLGFLVGSLLGSFLFAPKGPSVGKVSDVKVTSSTYGTPIQEGFGYCRVGGNIIQASDLKEHKKSVGKGLGGGGTQYTYTWTGAVGIAKGPIADVTRIWADSKLVFDKTGATSQKTLNQYKLKFRLYLGTEDQLPDAAMEDLVGADNAVPYRGLAYIVFDNIPVIDYGNRVPSWTFEVAFNEVGAVTTTAHKMADSTVVTGVDGGTCIVDWSSNRGWFFSSGTGGSNGVRMNALNSGNVIDYSTPAEMGLADGITAQAACRDSSGSLYLTQSGSGNQAIVYKVDGDGLTYISQFGPAGTGFPGYNVTGFSPQGMLIPIDIDGRTFIFGIAAGSILGTDVGVFCGDTMTVLDLPASSGLYTASGHGGSACHACTGGSVWGGSVFVSFNANFGLSPTDPVIIARYDIDSEGQIVGNTVVATINPSDVNPNWTNFNDHDGLTLDATDGNLICGFSSPDTATTGNSKHYICKINASDGSIMWATHTNAIRKTSGTMPQDNLVNGTYSFIGSNGESFTGAGDNVAGGSSLVYDIVTLDGSYSTETWPAFVDSGSGQVWDANAGAVLFYGQMTGVTSGSDKWIVIYVNRAQANAVGLDFIVSTVCQQVGLTTDDIDVTDLADIEVEGYLISEQQSAKDSLAPLALAFLFDGVEVDDKIKFVKRGHDSVVTIPQSDLSVMDTQTNATSQETRTQEVDLPREISIQFLDPNHDYQQATMYYRRPTSPAQTMRSANVQSVSLPIVMEPLAAKQLAETILFTSWVERVGYSVNLPWSYMKYDPSDNAVLTLSDGATIPVRFTEMNIGANLTVAMTAVAESGATYVPGVTNADGGSGFVPQVISAPTTNRLFLIDMPLPRDTDSQADVGILYYAAGAYDEQWPGMEFYKSTDNNSFADQGGVTKPATWGVCQNVLGDTDTPFGIDVKNTLTVSMMVGSEELASASLVDVCNGANAAVILNTSTGVVEIIQFTTVVDNGDGSFVLSGLIRGRRGTEIYTGTHSGGEVFILLSDSSATTDTGVGGITLGLGELDVVRYYKGVATGFSIELTASQKFTATGRNLKPYAPTGQTATLSGSDIDLAWMRRTRLGGEWKDFSGTVPVSEDTESYEIDIYNGADVVRTLTATTTAATYLAADITTDFGSTPTSLKIAVYQMSGQVGRGFTKIVTIPVN